MQEIDRKALDLRASRTVQNVTDDWEPPTTTVGVAIMVCAEPTRCRRVSAALRGVLFAALFFGPVLVHYLILLLALLLLPVLFLLQQH